jgi:predicted DNA-binding WGR domain protein
MNLVAHYNKGNSDKVYIVSIIVKDGFPNVIAQWGRVGSSLQSQFKYKASTLDRAEVLAKDLFRSKLNKGYVDIDSPSYLGELKMNPTLKVWLRPYLAPDAANSTFLNPQPASVVSPSPVKPVQEVKLVQDFEVECINNLGLEDKFDVGVTYVAEHHDDKDLYWVYDKLGEKQSVFVERFKKVGI